MLRLRSSLAVATPAASSHPEYPRPPPEIHAPHSGFACAGWWSGHFKSYVAMRRFQYYPVYRMISWHPPGRSLRGRLRHRTDRVGGMVIRTRLPEVDHKRLDAILGRLQKIRCAIMASRQPASLLEPDELMVRAMNMPG